MDDKRSFAKERGIMTKLPEIGYIEELNDDDIDLQGKWYNNLNGLYLYNGEFQGIFSRLGPLPTISKEHQGMTAATLHVRG